jgi:hypothetical protein
VRRWLVLGGALLMLGGAYWALTMALKVLALPRFDIPFAEPGAGSCFGRYDPDEWVVLALLALGLCWAPLGWARARRGLVIRCLLSMALLVGALGAAWLAVVARDVVAIFDALTAWRVTAAGVSHPGFEYRSYELLLDAAQLGLGIGAFSLALLVLCARLQERSRSGAELLAATRAGLVLLLGAVLARVPARRARFVGWLVDDGDRLLCRVRPADVCGVAARTALGGSFGASRVRRAVCAESRQLGGIVSVPGHRRAQRRAVGRHVATVFGRRRRRSGVESGGAAERARRELGGPGLAQCARVPRSLRA